MHEISLAVHVGIALVMSAAELKQRATRRSIWLRLLAHGPRAHPARYVFPLILITCTRNNHKIAFRFVRHVRNTFDLNTSQLARLQTFETS